MINMFKKKNELPPWPKPPTYDQMLEDITFASIDDPVFTEFNKQTKAASDKSNVDDTYDQVKQFLNVSKRLDECMANLGVQNNVLVSSNNELKKMADDIRQQAVDALK